MLESLAWRQPDPEAGKQWKFHQKNMAKFWWIFDGKYHGIYDL